MKIKEKKVKESREVRYFQKMPIWKSLLIMATPAMILMFVFGLYTFADNVLSINFANDSYEKYAATPAAKATGYTSGDFVRLFMTGVTPITTFIFSVTMLFGVGLSARFSINIGAKRDKRAIQTMSTSIQVSLIVSALLAVLLIFVSKAWMRSQFDKNPIIADLVAKEGFKYVWIIIISFPLQMFNQQLTSILRAEARNKEVMVALILPIMINLLLDWVFMGPMGMGIEGGAWATFISYVLTTLLILFYIYKSKSSRITFKNIFGTKNFKWVTLIGVFLLGASPFLRNMAQSITQTAELRTLQDVSTAVYGDNMMMSKIMTATFPIFGLFFPMIFGFIQAGSPIIGYNYGAKNMKRVKQTTLFIVLYSCIAGAIIYVFACFVMNGILLDILQIKNSSSFAVVDKGMADSIKDLKGIAYTAKPMFPGSTAMLYEFKGLSVDVVGKAHNSLIIMMIITPIFGGALGAMALFGSTDRLLLNIFASTLRGVVLLFPFMYLFAGIAEAHSGNVLENLFGNHSIFSYEYLFFWFYPALGVTTIIILTSVMIFTLKRIDRKRMTLEERLQKIYDRFQDKKAKRKSAT